MCRFELFTYIAAQNTKHKTATTQHPSMTCLQNIHCVTTVEEQTTQIDHDTHLPHRALLHVCWTAINTNLNLTMPWWISPPLPTNPFTTFYSRKSIHLLTQISLATIPVFSSQSFLVLGFSHTVSAASNPKMKFQKMQCNLWCCAMLLDWTSLGCQQRVCYMAFREILLQDTADSPGRAR